MGQRVGPHLYLDFADTGKIDAGPNSAATFNAGMIFLHELKHAQGLKDPSGFLLSKPPDLRGDTVDHVNQVRRELGLPLRQRYITHTDSKGRHIYRLVRGRFTFLRGCNEMKSYTPTIVAMVVCLASCATGNLQTRQQAQLPHGIFPALCEVFRREPGYDADVTTKIVSRTQPIYRTFALRVLHSAGALTPSEADSDEASDQNLRRSHEPVSVQLAPAKGSCSWVVTDARASGELVLEFSNVIEDPFKKGSFGAFVRHSLGGEAASWYWIAFEHRGDAWEVAHVSELAISD